ncbi:AAA family ATPase [bacterium]|nr:AAA family ATPase [bacterium]
MFYADLHVHSKYSRATSRDLDLEHLAIWGQRKGLSVIATGDFTHPAWMQEIRDKLVPAEPGLFRLKDDIQRQVDEQVEGACQAPVRFILEVEISTIYKKGEKTRKVHHLIYSPDLEKADRIVAALDRIGNLKSDGRPILGLDSRDLLEITLDGGEGCFLIPAHIWTPWFSAMGSKSGFDSINDCYGDLASHIFAVETGLSSDPAMNWRLSQLDRFTLVSNSDAHSPPKLGREACAFEADLDYWSIRRALETREGYAGTVEFFPEEGKYHMDGHRKCGVRQTPEQSRTTNRCCPECGRELTIGVLNRVDELADRPTGFVPDDPMPFRSLIPLPEVISELRGVGPASKKVQSAWHELIGRVGNELFILNDAPLEDIRRAGAPLVAEAVERMRRGEVIAEGGYDGEYGVIRVFQPGELARGSKAPLLFELPSSEARESSDDTACSHALRGNTATEAPHPRTKIDAERCGERSHTEHRNERLSREPESQEHSSFLDGLDETQRHAASMLDGPLLIVAGPGTGKTRTLTHRIAHLISSRGVVPECCLTVTFSRRAATELSERLSELLPDVGRRVPAMTFHSLGQLLLRENPAAAGLPQNFRVAGDLERRLLIEERLQVPERKARQLLSRVSEFKRAGWRGAADSETVEAFEACSAVLADRGLLDFDDLILKAAELLEQNPKLRDACRKRWQWLSLDEYQDIDATQVRLVRQLVSADGNVCAIGDPDQAIYGFRGASPEAFLHFVDDFPSAKCVELKLNYRSSKTIVGAAAQVIAPGSLIEGREFEAAADLAERITIRRCPTAAAEAEFVAHSIERLIGGSTFFSFDSERVGSSFAGGDQHSDLSFGDFAVLYRTEAQAESLREALQRSGMPFEVRSHKTLSDDPAVQSLLKRLIAAAAEWQSATSADETPSLLDRPLSVADRIKQIADELWEHDSAAAERLTQLVPIALRCGSDVNRFVSEVSLSVDSDLWDCRADRISLMTLHASKGLEFPVVFVTGCEDGLLPLRFGSSSMTDVAEERRLFFVGMTRAQRRLLLTHADRRVRFGKPVEMTPSPFLKEIEDQLLEHATASPSKKKRPAHQQLRLF